MSEPEVDRPEELRNIRDRLLAISKRMEIFATLYTHHFDLPIQDYLELIDVLTLWTWKSEELADLESNLSRAEEPAPRHKIMQGCYMFDYTNKAPVTSAAFPSRLICPIIKLYQRYFETLLHPY